MDRQIIEYLPPFLREVREFRGIAAALQTAFSGNWDAVYWVLDNLFIFTADDVGLSRWEELLDLVPPGGATLEDRRFAILARIETQLPFTYRQLHLMLTLLLGADGYTLHLDRINKYLKVLVELPIGYRRDAVADMLHRITPLNLVLWVGGRLTEPITTNQYLAGARFDFIRETIIQDQNTEDILDG